MTSFKTWIESKKMDKICYIIRGFPGSGKSTTTNAILNLYNVDENHVFSTDNYWIPQTIAKRKVGLPVSSQEEMKEYRDNWTPKKLSEAHQWNFDNFKNTVNHGITPVIVDNTNVKIRDFEDYVKYAQRAGYEIKFEEPTSPWWVENRPYLSSKDLHARKLDDLAKLLASKNTHGVPEFVIRNMIDKWQEV